MHDIKKHAQKNAVLLKSVHLFLVAILCTELKINSMVYESHFILNNSSSNSHVLESVPAIGMDVSTSVRFMITNIFGAGQIFFVCSPTPAPVGRGPHQSPVAVPFDFLPCAGHTSASQLHPLSITASLSGSSLLFYLLRLHGPTRASAQLTQESLMPQTIK